MAYCCPICHKVLKSQKAVKTHRARHHLKIEDLPPELQKKVQEVAKRAKELGFGFEIMVIQTSKKEQRNGY